MGERKIFYPPNNIVQKSYIKSIEEYKKLYKESLKDPNKFWEQFAKKYYWKTPTSYNATWNFDVNNGPIFIKWFDGGSMNLAYNLLDLQIKNGYGSTQALIWIPNDPSEREIILTYDQLLKEVCKFCKVLKAKGVKKGDRICLYMPMIIQLPIAMMACVRLGAIHSVVFGGYSSESVAIRIQDAGCEILITADGYFRGNKYIDLKSIADEAMDITKSKNVPIKTCIVVRHVSPNSNDTNGVETSSHACKRPKHDLKINWNDERDVWWDEEIKLLTDTGNEYVEPEWMDPEDPLFMLYTSGSTGTPKGVLHTCAGYMVYVATTFKYVFDYHEGDIFFCAADIGWITGHSYVLYGPLLNGATSIMFEGIPTFPKADRYWKIIEKFRVSKFYSSPTAIRALMKFGKEIVQKNDLSSLEILATVGEPINPEAWLWFHDVVGQGRCVVIDTYFQTETGGHIITPLPAAIPTKPGSATLPFFGVEAVILDEEGNEITDQREGLLCFKQPWPGMLRTVYNCPERFEKGYFHKHPGYYTSGDGAHRDSDGYFWIAGRIDDMMNVSGHLLSTAAIESALNSHPALIECAAIAVPHNIKGQALYCFVTFNSGIEHDERLMKDLKETVAHKIGRFAVPDIIQPAHALPKTRSGKIMRRILRAIAQGANENDKEALGDISTLVDESVIKELCQNRIPLK